MKVNFDSVGKGVLLMREIKFRAWDKAEKHFWYFTLQEVLERRESYRGSFDETILREEKMQYSGLKDNSENKNEVYEGDIIECIGWEGTYFVVEFIDCAFYAKSVTFRNIPCWRTEYTKLDELQEFKVVGNIYEDSELLEGEKL